jgi:hypothetical protein
MNKSAFVFSAFVVLTTGEVHSLEFGADPAAGLSAADRKAYAKIQEMKWWDACVAWGRETRKPNNDARASLYVRYLKGERMLSPTDLGHVNDKSVDIGMTECGMFASKGMPEAANHTTTAAGTSTQYVYAGRRMYIYVAPSREYSVGVVRSIQH